MNDENKTHFRKAFKSCYLAAVDITEELRNLVFHLSNEMHHLYEQNITTPAEISKNCKECSLVDICMPRITKKKVSIANYMSQRLDEDLT